MFYLYHKAAYDPLIDLYEKDSNYDVYLSLSHEAEKKFKIFKKDITNKYLNLFEQQGHKVSNENETFDIVFIPDVVNEKKYGDAILCLIYHGISFTKTVTYRELKKHTDSKYYIFLEGEQSFDSMVKSGAAGKSELIKVGYPKMDYYFKKKYYDKNLILESLGLDPNKKTILFAPTYKPTCIYEIKDLIFEKTLDYNLIIKLHHYAWLGRFASHSQHLIFENRVEKYPNSIIIPKDDYNIMPLYYVSDTMISEASGAITEFLATGKTGIIYDLDNHQKKHSDGESLLTFNNNEYLNKSFIHVNKNSLGEGIKKALNPTQEMKLAQKKDIDKIFYKLNGEASNRTKLKIKNIYNKKIEKTKNGL